MVHRRGTIKFMVTRASKVKGRSPVKGERPVGLVKGTAIKKATGGVPTTELSRSEEMQMFAVYCEKPLFKFVAKVTGYALTTVKRHAKKYAWESRRREIVKRSQEMAEYDIVKAKAKSLKMIKKLKDEMEARIDRLIPEDLNSNTLVMDLGSIIKMEQYLLGEPESRTENVVSSHEDRIKQLRALRGAMEVDVTPEAPQASDGEPGGGT